jgi:phage baseplate assembly protein gpV
MPVIAFYRRHGQGLATVDVRRIRQENIEVLARSTITLDAKDFVNIKAETVNIEASTINLKADDFNVTAETSVKGNISQVGNYSMQGNQSITGSQTINGSSTSYGNQTINGSVSATVDVKAGGISLKSHKHGGVDTGGGSTSGPQ